MIRITDMTLSCLDAFSPTARQLSELCELLLQTGADCTELSILAFHTLGCLPPSGRYILRCENAAQAREYPQFDAFVCYRSGKATSVEIISEIQANDIRELYLLNSFESLQNVRIRGLDDILNHDYTPAFQYLQRRFSGKIQLCPENGYHCATAIAVEWIANGGHDAAASFAGIGGFAPLEEVLMALRLQQRRKPNADFSVFPRIRELMEEITGEPVAKSKPVIGEDIFCVEAGIHVNGISKDPGIYEPFKPEIVGNERKLVVGKHSGESSIRIKIQELGLAEKAGILPVLLAAVRKKSICQQRSLTDEEFTGLYYEVEQRLKNGGEGA